MKKYTTAVLVCTTLVFAYCSSSKKAAVAAKPKSTYEAQVKPIVETYCSPCHIPAKGGNKARLDDFASLNASIDEVIRRIELNPGERGFMPMRKAKLSDSTIAVFKQWKADGLLEK